MPQTDPNGYAVVNINLAQGIQSRNSNFQYDSLLQNCYPEKTIDEEGQTNVVRRFGYASYQTLSAGQALGLFTYNNETVAVVGTTAYLNGVSLGTVDGSSPYQFTLTSGTTGFFLKNNTHAYFYNGASLTQVTDANYPTTTATGVAELDTYTFVLTPGGVLWNSQLGTPATWNALNYQNAFANADQGVAISRYLQFVICFGAQSMTSFYDNGNYPGSPLLRNIAADQNVGCACGASVVQTRNTIFWVGQTRQRGRSVYILDGMIPKAVSNTYVDRILASSNLTEVYAYFIEINGHYLYILTLKDQNVTLVFDMQTNEWHIWSSSVAGTPQTSTSGSVSSGIVTLTVPNHGLTNGSVVAIAGPAPAQFTGTFLVNAPDSNTLTYYEGTSLSGGINSQQINKFAINKEPIQTITGGVLPSLTVTPWNQNYFACAYYTFVSGTDLLLNETTGQIYTIAEGLSNDNGTFIYMSARTESWDGETNERKFMSSFEVVGDKFEDTAYIGWSDNDYQSFGNFRPLDMQSDRTQVLRCGKFRRRAFQLIYIGPFLARWYRAQIKIQKGTM